MNDELGQRRTINTARAKLREALEDFAVENGLPPSEADVIEELVTNRMREIVAEEAGHATPSSAHGGRETKDPATPPESGKE